MESVDRNDSEELKYHEMAMDTENEALNMQKQSSNQPQALDMSHDPDMKMRYCEVNRNNESEALDMQVKSNQLKALDMSHVTDMRVKDGLFTKYDQHDHANGKEVSNDEETDSLDMEEKIRKEFCVEDDDDRRAQIAQTAREIELLRKASNGDSPHSLRESHVDNISASHEPYSRLLHTNSVAAVSHSITSWYVSIIDSH